ncbi:hypothetical protein L1987_88540 [Smallanthus sonchifolius]|nr:hypothetical protein L1987_89708 [Smallanthus sonchifolius]KAI3666080.1 hypothetical protein L1987_89431 [Smallanthus sonchifolius]KAI3668460.1 hypothetical protein L1987_88540 [Smallanthus sonchifolius]
MWSALLPACLLSLDGISQYPSSCFPCVLHRRSPDVSLIPLLSMESAKHWELPGEELGTGTRRSENHLNGGIDCISSFVPHSNWGSKSTKFDDLLRERRSKSMLLKTLQDMSGRPPLIVYEQNTSPKARCLLNVVWDGLVVAPFSSTVDGTQSKDFLPDPIPGLKEKAVDKKAVKTAPYDEGRGAASTLSVVLGAKCWKYRLVRDNQYPHFLIAIAETSVDGRG